MNFRTSHIRGRLNKKERGNFLFFIIVAIIVGIFFFYNYIKSTGNTIVKSGKYTITRGTTLQEIPTLFSMNISPWRYKLWLRYFLDDIPKLQAGTYEVTKTSTLSELVSNILTKPMITDLTITIIPGWNIYDIDEYLSNKKIIQPGDILLASRDHFSSFQSKYSFLKGKPSLEGFLYPDTYRILPTADAYMILDRLLKEFEKKIGPSYSSLGEKEGYESLILASIVEREERVSSEKPIVADILAKRVKEGIPMGADATVCYGYAKTQKQCTPQFINEVIYKKDSYNTRNKRGYPPTPISNISLETWEAVINKKPSPYYYYLHDENGKIWYARTLEEHNSNKSKYIR